MLLVIQWVMVTTYSLYRYCICEILKARHLAIFNICLVLKQLN